MRLVRFFGAAPAAALLVLIGCADQASDSTGEPPASSPVDAPAGSDDTAAEAPAPAPAAAPEVAPAPQAAHPATTRAGTRRFTGREVRDPGATRAFLDRFASEPDPAVRAALAEALPRTEGAWAGELGRLLAAEADPDVRAVLVAIAWRAPAEQGIRVLAAGLDDADARVRAEAARTAGRHRAGGQLVDALAARLSDPAAPVRAAAAEALGVRGAGRFTRLSALTALTADGDAEVRLQALRALERLAPEAEIAAPAARLRTDPDERVRRLADRLARAQR